MVLMQGYLGSGHQRHKTGIVAARRTLWQKRWRNGYPEPGE